MERFQLDSEMPVSAAQLYRWYLTPGAQLRMTPPWQKRNLFGTHSKIILSEPGVRFIDERVDGPLRSWRHEHRMTPVSDQRSLLQDSVDYEPFEKEVARIFAYRHRVAAADLDTLQRYPTSPLKIAVTGGLGLIGRSLIPFLESWGHQVVRLAHGSHWSPEKGLIESERVEGCDALIHLAGEGVAGRWTSGKKERIRKSRVEGTKALIASLELLDAPPKLLLASSGIGYYGEPVQEPATEGTPLGQGFLAEVCAEWEAAASRYSKGRVVLMRTGVVLSPSGGALGRMLPPFRAALGGVIGSGRQGMSWISIDDMVYQIYHLLMSKGVEGAYNLVAPHPVTQRQFAKSLAQLLHRPALLPMPALAVKLLLGEMGEELLLKGVTAIPQRLIESGARFHYPLLNGALHHLL